MSASAARCVLVRIHVDSSPGLRKEKAVVACDRGRLITWRNYSDENDYCLTFPVLPVWLSGLVCECIALFGVQAMRV